MDSKKEIVKDVEFKDTRKPENILDPKDLEEKALTLEQMKMLEMQKYLISSSDQNIFNMLPMDRLQKFKFLQKISTGEMV